MVILAIDTSGKNGSLALAQVKPEEAGIDVLEVSALAGGTFSAQLVPQLGAVLDRHRFQKSDIAGFAVVSGPGSFTGLRVGLAAVKGLAEILQKPVAAMSLLEAIARNGGEHDHVFSLLDAGRAQLYVGDYDLKPVQMRSERLLSREEFAAESKDRVVITSDPSLAEQVCSIGFVVEQVDHPRADVIARLGWDRILRAETVAPEVLEANYIRRSDAEIFSKPKI